MKTLHLGPEELLVAVEGRRAAGGHARPTSPRRSTRPRSRIREAVPIARVIYIEPDIYQGAAVS